jgi:hypothetical protein
VTDIIVPGFDETGEAESDTEEGSLVIDEGAVAKTKQPQSAQAKKAAVKRNMTVSTPEEVSVFYYYFSKTL